MTQPDLHPSHEYKEGAAVHHPAAGDGDGPLPGNNFPNLPDHPVAGHGAPVNSILRLDRRRVPSHGGGGSRVRFSRVYPVYNEPDSTNQSPEKGERRERSEAWIR